MNEQDQGIYQKTHEFNKNTMLSFNYANWIPHSFLILCGNPRLYLKQTVE